MAFKPPPIPENLTPKYWDKHKGIIAKMAGETGIGKALTALGELHAKTDWQKFDHCVPAEGFSPTSAEAKKHLDGAKTFVTKDLQLLVKEFKAVRDLCQETAKKFKANKLLAGSAKTVEDMAKTADLWSVGYQGNSYWIEAQYKILEKDLEAALFREKQLSGSIDQFFKVVAEIEKGLPEMKKLALAAAKALETIDVDDKNYQKFKTTYGDFHSEWVRGLGVTMKPFPEFKAIFAEWGKIVKDGSDMNAKKLDEMSATLGKIKKIGEGIQGKMVKK